MSGEVKELGTPALRPVWNAAKKKSADDAKKLKEDKIYAVLDKKFNGDLGPNLDAWPKLYPNYAKLTETSKKIEATIKSYQGAIKTSALNPKVIKVMIDALNEVQSAMTVRLKRAEELISSDVALALKDSKKKQTAPIIIFQQDIAAQVRAKSGDGAKILLIDKLEIEVMLTDDAVLKQVPNDLDDAVLAREIREAANFQRLVQDIATALGKSAKLVRRGQADLAPAKKDFETAVGQAIADAIDRATVPILKYTKVKTSVRNYKIKSGVSLGLTVLGAAAGVISMALTPLTLGVSTVVGAIALAKSGVTLGKQIADLSASAEEMAIGIAKDIVTLGTQYANAKKTLVGVGELGKTLVNATMPAMITTISGAKGDCATLEKKIENLIVDTHKAASNLGALLTKQSETQKALRAFEKIAAPVLASGEALVFSKLMALFDKSAASVNAMIEKVTQLDARVSKTAKTHKKLSSALNILASREPTWAQVGEVVINIAAGVGFMVAGSVNTPDPYQFATLANDINSGAGNALGSLDALKAGLDGLKDLLEKKARI